MFTLGCHFAHQASEVTEFVFAQSALPPPDRELPDAFRGIPSDDAETSGVAEQGPQGTNRSTGDAGAPGRPAPASFRPSAKGPAVGAACTDSPSRARATLHSPRSRRQSSSRSPFRVKARCNSQDASHCTVRWHFRLRRWQGGRRSKPCTGGASMPTSSAKQPSDGSASPSPFLATDPSRPAQTERFSLWRATQPFKQPPECA